MKVWSALLLIAALITMGAVAQTPPSTDRTLTIVNQCPAQTLNVGAIGGFVQNCGAAPGYECPTGTQCNTSRSPAPGCFWALPSATSGTSVLGTGQSVVYTLTAPPISETVPIPGGGTQTIQVKWSGSVFAATGCDANGQNCATGMCNLKGKPVVCSTPGVAPFPGPLSAAEFTFAPFGPDYYDITVINGMNVPVSMAPASVTSQSGSNAYFCQTPGSITASGTGLQACNWTVSPSSSQAPIMAAVTSSGTACPKTGSCPGGQTCGLSPAFGTTTLTQTCGTQIGWWTPDEICAFTGNGYGAPINCSANVSLYECVGTNATSCYNSAADSTCCGCPSWKINGKPLQTEMTCVSTNPQWTKLSLPWLSPLKSACPTVYTFPFDDATSLFTCNTANASTASPNTMNYTITFCPGGKTGLPAAASAEAKPRRRMRKGA
ncbi:MAG TPA: thaumatin family protein [Thermoanaerobaculia bacterium]|nr:thaumatin family protein [Thermoanaerobaculia bacterium]